jgi:DNA phosphorothioation-dependent restriction protein DptG
MGTVSILGGSGLVSLGLFLLASICFFQGFYSFIQINQLLLNIPSHHIIRIGPLAAPSATILPFRACDRTL